MKNTDLRVQILLQKCWTEIMETLVLENQYKIIVPIFGAAYLLSTVLSPTENSGIQGLFKAFELFSSTFKADLIFKDFSRSPLNSSTFQACGNPVNSCHAEYFDVLHSSPNFIQLPCCIPNVSIYFQSEWKTVWILTGGKG